MIHPDEALRIIENLDPSLGSESLPLEACLGRIPVTPPLARFDQPPFDKATMDGFAYTGPEGSFARAGQRFRLIDSIAAGKPASRPLMPGECIRIMTGAVLPKAAQASDWVIVHRLERAAGLEDSMEIIQTESEANRILRAANRKKGDKLFDPRPLRPQEIGILAANGFAELEVKALPRVRVFSSGDEIAGAADQDAGLAEGLGRYRIFDSNGPQLVAQAKAWGCSVDFGGIIPDNKDQLAQALRQAGGEADLILISGGVSAGDFDYVPQAAQSAGFTPIFHGVAIKPGKPVFFARKNSTFIFGMPGNPVSAFVIFEIFVKPLLGRMAGLHYRPKTESLRLGTAIDKTDKERVEFLPVRIEGRIALPLRYTGSTMIDVLAEADALIRMDIGQNRLEEGGEIEARLL